MRAEDLFEAMEGIDEELITRSENRAQSAGKETDGRSAKKAKKKRRKKASVYRFAVITLSTAAVVFLFLLARDFVGVRSGLKDSQPVTRESEALYGNQAEEEMADAAAEDPQSYADEAAGSESADRSSEESPADQAENESVYDSTEKSAPSAGAAEDSVPAEGALEEAENGVQADAADSGSGEAEEKTAVDLLGDLKGDYVGLEYISAEDEANGGSRTVPEYTQEGEIALSNALDSGKAKPAILADTGRPVYYVYLIKENGDEDKVTFYENAYVSMDSIPGMVMKISHAEYEAVMELFN